MAVAKEQIRQIISENNINSVADIYTLLKDSFKDILQELMEAELDATPGYEKNHKGDLQTDNKRNGHSTKNLKSQYGEFQIDVPRDRNGEFEPKLIPKYQRDISGIEEKVISLYARGMSTRDIHDQLQDLYGIELSAEMVSKITDKILPQVKEWQSRPLNPVYPFVFMDCIHYKVREDGRILMLVIDSEKLSQQIHETESDYMEKSKEVLANGQETEGAKYQGKVLNRKKKLYYGVLRIIIRPLRQLL